MNHSVGFDICMFDLNLNGTEKASSLSGSTPLSAAPDHCQVLLRLLVPNTWQPTSGKPFLNQKILICRQSVKMN